MHVKFLSGQLLIEQSLPVDHEHVIACTHHTTTTKHSHVCVTEMEVGKLQLFCVENKVKEEWEEREASTVFV